MSDVEIRPALVVDLAALSTAFGDEEYFADRFARQQSARGVLLTAWRAGELIGDAYLWLEPAEEPEIRRHLPGVPLLTHVEIHPDHRNRGFGAELMWAAERMLADLRFDRVALAVRVDNVGAYRLYDRLGYKDWRRPPVECLLFAEQLADGSRKQGTETCHVMVKTLVSG